MAVTVLCLLVLSLVYTNQLNAVYSLLYTVQGVDVSHYQGKIDWNQMQKNGVDFAYIKATEGSGSVDETFEANRHGAEEAGVLWGPYHFFSFDSEPETQAELFTNTVGPLSGHLIPVLDVEYYGDKRVNPPEKEELVSKISEMLTYIEEAYSVKPMIYTTYPFYEAYIRGSFEEYPLWIRNTYVPPFDKTGKWTFWQYTDTAKMPDCYTGTEDCIDRDVFIGSEKELTDFVVP